MRRSEKIRKKGSSGGFSSGVFRRILLPLMAGAVLFVTGFSAARFPVYAAEKPADMSEETYAKLQDNVIEFDEIPDLVEMYSFPAKLQDSLISDNSRDLQAIYDELTNEIDDLNDEIRTLEDERNDAEDAATKSVYTQQIQVMKQYRSLLSNSRDKGQSSVKAGLKAAKNAINGSFHTTLLTMTKGMEDLFFGYKQLEAVDQLYESQVELYTRMYNMELTMQQNGSATALDVQNALSTLNNAKLNKASYDEQLRFLRDTLGTSLGWKQENTGAITLGSCPAYDPAYIASRNLSDDITTCAQANASYSAAQRIQDQDPYTWDNREIQIKKADGELRIAMEGLYNASREAAAQKEASDAACLTAKRTAEQAERARKAGISGETAYQGQMVSCYAAELREEQSAINAAKADNDYRWALKGILG